MAYTVYLHIFPNGKKYVGITSQDVNRRWREGEGYVGQPVYNAILKYGWANIKHIILFTGLAKAEAEAKERELIKALNTDSHKNGYNVEEGGKVSPLAPETKEKLRQSRIEYYKTHKHPRKGATLSAETKAKISKARKGQKHSKEMLDRLSKRFKGANNPMYGVKMTPAHKIKIQEASVKACSKSCVCLETQTVYKSIAEASRQTGINSRGISHVCNKDPRYKTAGGYHWAFREVI